MQTAAARTQTATQTATIARQSAIENKKRAIVEFDDRPFFINRRKASHAARFNPLFGQQMLLPRLADLLPFCLINTRLLSKKLITE